MCVCMCVYLWYIYVCVPIVCGVTDPIVNPLTAADFVLFNVTFSPEVSSGAFSRMMRALMGAAQGRLILHAHVKPDHPLSLESVTACMANLLGDEIIGLASQERSCTVTTATLLEGIAGACGGACGCVHGCLHALY
jgi:hypothetical protein